MFTSEFSHKVDRKGRVSVPAEYRNSLASQSFQGIVVIPVWGERALDAYGNDRLEDLARSLDDPGLYDEDELVEAQQLFTEARRLPFDGEGRILLPEECVAHCELGEQVVYAGMGPHFRLWNPEAFADHKARIRERAAAKGRPLRLRPPPPARGA